MPGKSRDILIFLCLHHNLPFIFCCDFAGEPQLLHKAELSAAWPFFFFPFSFLVNYSSARSRWSQEQQRIGVCSAFRCVLIWDFPRTKHAACAGCWQNNDPGIPQLCPSGKLSITEHPVRFINLIPIALIVLHISLCTV